MLNLIPQHNNIQQTTMIRTIRYFASDVSSHLRNISRFGINNRNILFNPSVSDIYEVAFLQEPPSDPSTRQTYASVNGALCAYSGQKLVRQPQNSRVVKDDQTEKDVNWGINNIPLSKDSFKLIEQFAVDYINHKRRCIIVDGYAGWDPQNRLKVRTYCTRSYHALFMKNMLIRPTEKQILEDFSKGTDVNIFNSGQMHVSKNIPGLTDTTTTSLDLNQKKLVILGTQFAGEMKKALFKLLNYTYPKKGLLPLHASATVGKNGDYTIMCGLSATGKTALAMRDNRKILADDELYWSDNGIAGIEGGCYAKTFNLDPNVEPQIHNSIRFGTLVQNANFYADSREINFYDSSITQNIRASFPLQYLSHSQLPAVGKHPTNIIFLTCDTKGVLPPIARLTHEQAGYQFLSGYTAKVPKGQEEYQEPKSLFSACFGEIFLPLHPSVYAKMFYQKIKKHNVKVWLINTGWTGGKYGKGQRMSFKDSSALVDAIHNGSLENATYKKFPFFNFQVPELVEGVPSELLNPSLGWGSRIQYEETLSALALEFIKNFDSKYKGKLGDLESAIAGGAPTI